MTPVAIMQLIMTVTDLMVTAPLQYAKLKSMLDNGTLTDDQVNQLIASANQSSDDMLALIDSL